MDPEFSESASRVVFQDSRRPDPESLVGECELFVYYALLEGGTAQLRLCRTGIFERT